MRRITSSRRQLSGTKSSLPCSRFKKVHYVLLPTGTPATSLPAELWIQLHLLNPDRFPSEYCTASRIASVSRARGHLAALSPVRITRRGFSTCSMRHSIWREKKNPLHNLPPKTTGTGHSEMSRSPKIWRAHSTGRDAAVCRIR